MRLFEFLLLANLLVFIAIVAPLPDIARWTGYLVFTGLLLAVLQILLEGARWQMLPAYGLSLLFLVTWLLPGLIPTARLANGIVIGLGVILGALALGASIALPLILPTVRFPQPTGPYGIGTLTYHWADHTRRELFTTDPAARRELVAQVWYPAEVEPSAPTAPYVQADATATLARASHLPSFTYGHWKHLAGGRSLAVSRRSGVGLS